jgi:hypothetical protein
LLKSTLEQELPVLRAGTRLKVLIAFFDLGGHVSGQTNREFNGV